MNLKDNALLLPVAAVALIVGFALQGVITEPDTKTVTEKYTPSACSDALDKAEDIVHGPVGDSYDDAITLAGLIPDAYKAGVTGSRVLTQRVVETMNEITRQTRLRNKDLKFLVDEYNTLSEECRDSGDSSLDS